MIPGFWLTEGGQSATGALIDHVISTHPAAGRLRREARRAGQTVYERLNARLAEMARAEKVAHPAELTRDLHVQPDFHGNRSPRADASLKGAIAGLTLADSVDDLARLYLATIQAVAYGTRHIIEEMNRRGYRIDTLFYVAAGGGPRIRFSCGKHADITGCRVVLPAASRKPCCSVPPSSAPWRHGSIARYWPRMRAMNGAGRVVAPAGGARRRFHAAKYRVFHRLHRDFLA